MSEWLVRTEKNQILGPFSEAEIKEMILSKKLELQDEICSAGQYWFYIHEKKEIQKHLGMIAPTVELQDGSEETDPFLATELPTRDFSLSKSEGLEFTTVISIPSQRGEVESSVSPPGNRPKVSSDHLGLQRGQKRFHRWLKVWLVLALGLIGIGLLLRGFFGSK